MAVSLKEKEDKKKLGRLTSFGLKHPWQSALLLPNGWDDMTVVVDSFMEDIPLETYSLFLCKCPTKPEFNYDNKTPRIKGSLTDKFGNIVQFIKFGDTKYFVDLLEKSNGSPLYIYGKVTIFNNKKWINDPEIVNPWWVGKFRPRYPAKTGVIGAELVRSRILKMLNESFAPASQWILDQLSCFGDEDKLMSIVGSEKRLVEILKSCHLPQTVEEGQLAQSLMDKLASLGVAKESRQAMRRSTSQTTLGDWENLAKNIPFDLTPEQKQNVREICDKLQSENVLHGLLCGDVGFGKTAVYGTVAAAVADAGGTVVVLLPSETLAKQVARNDICTWFKKIPTCLMAGDDIEGDPDTAKIFIGTTALLHRLDKTIHKPSLVIIDEQQRFSREQRERLLTDDTHLLEVSATPIPRTGALIRYGVVDVWYLTKAFRQKNIKTQIWYSFEKKELFTQISWSLNQSHQVLVVYPLKDVTEKDESAEESGPKGPPLPSVMEAFDQWNNIFPGQVRYLHSDMKTEEKEQSMSDMVEGRANILLATTVVEVGVNIPNLRRVVVMHPDRFGLSQLHQIRGRAARLGGDGYCDLFVARPNIKEATMKRLEILEKHIEGSRIAEEDMKLRGIGNLGKDSDKQTGADDTFLFGRSVTIEALDEVMKQVYGQEIQEQDSKISPTFTPERQSPESSRPTKTGNKETQNPVEEGKQEQSPQDNRPTKTDIPEDHPALQKIGAVKRRSPSQQKFTTREAVERGQVEHIGEESQMGLFGQKVIQGRNQPQEIQVNHGPLGAKPSVNF